MEHTLASHDSNEEQRESCGGYQHLSTPGDVRERFVKRPRQTSMYYRYDRGVAMIPLPRWGRAEDWRRTPPKKYQHLSTPALPEKASCTVFSWLL